MIRVTKSRRNDPGGMKDSRHSLSPRSVVAVIVVVGLSSLILNYAGGIYYKPLCQRYADSRQLKFHSYHTASRKHESDWPAQCFFHDKNGDMKRVEVDTLSLTSGDWVRWVLSWVATIGGVGGSVWLASVISGFKAGRRRR